MIEAVEEVEVIENKLDKFLVQEIIQNSHNYGWVDDFISNLRFKYGTDTITFEDEKAIKNLWHVYWYYGYTGYSYVVFLTILPFTALLFLTVGAAGAFGGAARILIDHARNVVLIENSKFVTFPMFGFFMGVLVLAISYLIPSIFVKGDTQLNTSVVVLICVFSGIFSNRFYDWIIGIMEKFLKSRKPS